MKILILGFGKLSRELLAKIKSFPEYGEHKEIAASHVHINRNSLSYGPDYVVEIPDPHGDGYRTYNDGFQAINNYSTTVSDYEEHILGEIASGSFSVIIDCTNQTESSKELLAKIGDVVSHDVKLIRANTLQDSDEAVEEIRKIYNGGLPWVPFNYPPDALDQANAAWKDAQTTMAETHLRRRTEFVEDHPEMAGRTEKEWPRLEQLIPEVDRVSIKRFIVDNEPYSIEYSREESYDDEAKCRVVRHEMLNWFFGWHCMEGPATQVHANPKLKIASAKYVEYDSEDSISIKEEDYDYAIEYVVSGTLLLGDDMEIEEHVAYAYMPKKNPPRREVSKGLATMIFYYEEQNDN